MADVSGRMRWARLITLVSLAMALLTSLVGPSVGLFREQRPLWVILGAVGAVLFFGAQAHVLYGVVTDRRPPHAFLAAAALSVPLVAPVGADHTETWAWIGASIFGTAPVLFRRLAAVVVAGAAVVVAIGVALWTGGDVGDYVFVTAGVGLTLIVVHGLPVWMWELLREAQQGRAAQARLAVTEERLRFARDVHDLLGHNLSVIALKAELAARLASVDAERASREAAEVRQLATSALTDLREAVHGYRAVDLGDQLTAVEQVLTSAGIQCTVSGLDDELPAEIGTVLSLVLREAGTNVIRHSRARRCTIDIVRSGSEVRMTVVNDGATGGGPDTLSFGLRGVADRLAAVGGTLRTKEEDGVFTLEAAVQVTP